MKEHINLYHTIYCLAIYCLIALVGLFSLTGYLVYYFGQKGQTKLFFCMIILAVLCTVLIIFSIVIWVIFYKRYKLLLLQRKEEGVQDNEEDVKVSRQIREECNGK